MQVNRFLTLALLAAALAAAPARAVTLKWAAQNDVITLDPHSQNHATTNGIMQHLAVHVIGNGVAHEIERSGRGVGDVRAGQAQAGFHFGTFTVAGDKRIDDNLRDWRIGRGFLRSEAIPDREFSERDAIGRSHPEATLRLGQRVDFGDVLDPIGAGPTRHDHARGKAIQMR